MQEKLTSRRIGDIGEEAVCGFLQRHGYTILCRNFTIRGGEIDIIAEKGEILAFVEVKTRKRDPLTDAESAITQKKKDRIIKTAEAYLYKTGKESFCRFDVAAVELTGQKVTGLRYYVAAFDATKI